MLESTRIKTEIPGPKSRELMERRYKAVSSGVGIATPMFAKEAKGALLTDVDDNTFHRLRRRHRRVERGAHGLAGGRGGQAAGREPHPHLLLRHRVRGLSGAGREAERAGTGRHGEAFLLRQLRSRGGRERGQDRTLLHGPPGGDSLRELLPRPHDVRDEPHGQDRPVQEGFRAFCTRGIQGAFALRLPLSGGQRLRRRLPGRLLRDHRAGLREHGASQQRRRDNRRAGERRGRLHTVPRLLPETGCASCATSTASC